MATRSFLLPDLAIIVPNMDSEVTVSMGWEPCHGGYNETIALFYC